MTEAVVVYAVERLGELLISEGAALFLYGLRDEVKWLQTELTRMQCFLKDADQKQEVDESVRNWVSQVRNAAYDTEDIVDNFMLRSAVEKRGFFTSVKKYACILNRGITSYDIRRKIEEVKERIRDISHSRETYGISAVGNIQGSNSFTERLRQMRKTSSNAGKEQVVGFEENTKILVKQLLKDEKQRYVISILGMGGLGKTTLARKLYNSNDVKGLFECHAWVCVSQEFTTRDLLQKTIKSFQKPTKEHLKLMEKMTDEDLEQHLYEFLETRRYLVVIRMA